jgi:hypothetical protein
MWVGSNCGIVAGGIRKLHKGTILGMLATIFILGIEELTRCRETSKYFNSPYFSSSDLSSLA